VLHIRLRKGSAGSPRGATRFAEELIARVTRAGATGPKLLRADSAFWSKTLIVRLTNAGSEYSISVRMQYWVPVAVAEIPEEAWQPIEGYPEHGEAQIAETFVGGRRLIVRRTRLIRASRAVARLAALPVHHQPHRTAGDRRGRAPPARRRRARDPRPQGPGARALPSGRFAANSAWTVIGSRLSEGVQSASSG
jgi:hypothetical protein